MNRMQQFLNLTVHVRYEIKNRVRNWGQVRNGVCDQVSRIWDVTDQIEDQFLIQINKTLKKDI